MLPSISALFIEDQFYVDDVSRLTDRCPSLQILHFSKGLLVDAEDIRVFLEGRRDNVAAGLEVGGIKMESSRSSSFHSTNSPSQC